MNMEDGNFKQGRFNPVVIGLGILLAVGGGAAIYMGVKSDEQKLTVKQIAKMKADAYAMPKSARMAKWKEYAKPGQPWQLRQEAIAQLAVAKDKGVLDLATNALSDEDHRIRGVAAQAIAALAPASKGAGPALKKAFKEATNADKPQLAWALIAINDKSSFADVMAVYKAGHLASVQRAGGGSAFDVEIFAAMASPDDWAKMAGDENRGIRNLVASILAKTADKKFTDVLIKLVNDKDNTVAREAASGLGAIGDAKALKPLLDALRRADKDDRQAFLEALKDGVGGRGLVMAIPSVSKKTPEREIFQTKQIFDMLRSISDPRAGDELVKYLESNPKPHWFTQAAIALAEIGDARAVPYLAKRLTMDPTKIYTTPFEKIKWASDDKERVVSARMLADMAVLHPKKHEEFRKQAEKETLFWLTDKPQPHANGLRFLAIIKSEKVLPKLRTWAKPKDSLPKEGASGAFPTAFETAPSALRYLGWMKDKQSWPLFEKQLTRKEDKYDTTKEGMTGAGISMLGMVLRGLSVGASHGYAQWGDQKAFPILFKFAQEKKQNEGARMAACSSMAWVASNKDSLEVVKYIATHDKKDPKDEFIRRCMLETLVRKPFKGIQNGLLRLIEPKVDIDVRVQVARALGRPGFGPEIEKGLIQKLGNKELTGEAALALILGGSEDGTTKALATYAGRTKEELDDLKEKYFSSFGFWSNEDLEEGRVYHWVANAEAASRIRVKDVQQSWLRDQLGRQFKNLTIDSGPHSMTKVVARVRLAQIARSSKDPKVQASVVRTLLFMREQGTLMALKEDKGPLGKMAKEALFEFFNPPPPPSENTKKAPAGK